MAKNAVYSTIIPYHYEQNSELKKLSLLFDKIYFKKPSVKVMPSDEIGDDIKNRDTVVLINNELKLYEFLQSCKIIEEYESIPATKSQITSEIELQFISGYLKDLKEYSKSPIWKEESNVIYERLQKALTVQDIQARVDAVALSRISNSEFYPILKSNNFFTKKGKKTEVVHFTLNQIPEPTANTSWEQIIEFRTDQNVKNKYLALIHWINKKAASLSPMSDIQEEYEYLYSDYLKHFELHRMKYGFSTIEVLVTAGVDLLVSLASGHYLPAIKNLMTMRLSKINLLQEEAKIPGKEIAYIYHINQKFSENYSASNNLISPFKL